MAWIDASTLPPHDGAYLAAWQGLDNDVVYDVLWFAARPPEMLKTEHHCNVWYIYDSMGDVNLTDIVLAWQPIDKYTRL